MSQNDLICFSETWRDPKDNLLLDLDANFTEFHEPGFKNHLGGRPSGGMSLLVRKSLIQHVSILFSDSYHFWVRVEKAAFGWEQDLFFCCLYIPPSTSILLRTGQSLSLDTLQSECACYEKRGWVLLCGDFNARTNDVNDFIENDELDDFLPVDENYLPDQHLDKRLNKDDSPLNTSGTAFIEFCKSSGYRIMNGRIDKNNSCNYTYFSQNGCSTVDYSLSLHQNFCMIDKLSVGKICELSDHSPMEISIKCPKNNRSEPPEQSPSDVATDDNELLQNYKRQFYIKNNSTLENLSSAMRNTEIIDFLDNISNHLDDDDFYVEDIIKSLRLKMLDLSEAGLNSRGIFPKNDNRTTPKKKCPWFDNECKKNKTLLNNKRKSYQAALKFSTNFTVDQVNNLKLLYFQQRRVYKKIIRYKRDSFLENEKLELWKLKGEAPKEFWKRLKKTTEKANLEFSNDHLSNYFSKLLKSDGSADNNELESPASSLDTMTQELIDDTLNSKISFEEVTKMAKKLKYGKASGLDMLSAELLKNANNKFFHVFTKLFNRLLESGKFPEEWSIGIIVVLFKGGDKTDLNNYRGITLLSIFGKFFLGVLLERLNNIISRFEILEENQIGFRKEYQTSDHIFTLRAIIENYFECNKGPLHVCFVDFRKAFDSVDHKLLLQKLVVYGIKGGFLKIIESLYEKVKSCVRGNDSLTDIFPCERGVRQGCLLSPVLFALYLNDLNNHIKASSQGVLVDDLPVHSLLYADDLVLIARSKTDLQSQLDALENFSKSLKMEVNMDKTKVMVIRKNKQKARAQSKNKKIWKMGDKEIKECDSYKYLGVTLKSNGSFSEHVDKIKEKAQKAYFSLISKSKEWGGFQPRLFLYLFEHTIIPILNYASEVWGFDEWAKLETLHLKACKYALGVRSNTTTDAIYAELGRMSLQRYRHISILKFYTRISLLSSERYASKAFSMLVKDTDSGCSNWVSQARDLQTRYEIQQSDNRLIIKSKVRKNFEQDILQKLNEHITEDKKLHLYASFKTTFKFEAYLDFLPNFKVRSTLAKLRVSAHNLQIETGRFNKIKTPREERFCIYCKTQNVSSVENEVHFLLSCPLYRDERKNFLDTIHRIAPSTMSLNDQNMFIWLMSQEDYKTTKLLGNFCKKLFDKRTRYFNNPVNS